MHKAANQLLMCRAMKAWTHFQSSKQHTRSAMLTAQRHFETTLMTHALCAWRHLCVHASSGERECVVAATDISREQQQLPPMACTGRSSRHTDGYTRPSSAGAGPKVGRCAQVVVGHVRQPSVGKKWRNQKRSQSTPRTAGSYQQQYALVDDARTHGASTK